jgi:hypothetical protein
MKQTLLENLKKDTSGKWVGIEDVAQLLDTVVKQAITAVENTGTQCAYTTYDLGTVQCTIERSVRALKDHFGIE